MPLYAFHIEVPVPPDAAAFRLRDAVGEPPTIWQSMAASWKARPLSGLPFIGYVGKRSFQIRLDSRYRNPFQPRMRGAINMTATGSRLDAWLFMNPLTVLSLLALFWYVPLVFAMLGLVAALWTFFFEATRVAPLLSAVICVPHSHAANLNTQVVADSRPSRSAVRRLALLAAVLIIGGPLAITIQYQYRLRSSPAYAKAIELVSQSDNAALLGNPIRAGLLVRGLLSEKPQAGFAALSIPISGPLKNGTLHIVANRAGSEWDVEGAVLETRGSSGKVEGRSLALPVSREQFSYPHSGPVYIQPLDDAAAADVRGLPDYYRARLDLEVVVLPALELGSDTLDVAAKQMIAEKALETMERSHANTLSNVDAVVLGVTSQDLNIQTSGWTFAINYRRGRIAIVSTFRLHETSRYIGSNPALYPVRVRKTVTKNLALLRYPLGLSSDPSSVLATATFSAADIDDASERFGGESSGALTESSDAPCVSILQGPGGKQSWRIGCTGEAPGDRRFELFEHYPGVPPLVMSRADFPIGGKRSLGFVRKYRTQDDSSRALGIGANHSYDIFPAGDSQTFSWIELILADGARIHYRRTSPGRSAGDAKLSAGTYMSSPFSRSSLEWRTSGGWDLRTIDGWLYQFPSSGPSQTAQQSALIGLQSESGESLGIRRNGAGDLLELRAPDGTAVEFTVDDKHRLAKATDSTGRQVLYAYDAQGRLVRVSDSRGEDESYEYDALNRLTVVLDAKHRPLLVNEYGVMGEIRSQTLADGSRLLYESGYDASRSLASLKLTLPNGYFIQWLRTRDGYSRTWPQAPHHGTRRPGA